MPDTKKFPLRLYLFDLVMLMTILPLLALIIFCFSLSYRIFHPPRRRHQGELKSNLQFEELKFESSDDVKLSALLAIPPNPQACVVICHEWGAHKATKLKYAEMVYEFGSAALLFDLHNHGESDSDPSWGDMSRRYTDDLSSALRIARGHPQLEHLPVIVLAFSFSTFPAVHCVAHRSDAWADGLILDSGPVISEFDIASRFMTFFGGMLFPKWLRGPIFSTIAKQLTKRLIVFFLRVEWPPPPSRLNKPMLVFCGADDVIAPEQQIRALIDQLPNARLHVVEGCPHLLAFKLAPQEYRMNVRTFIEAVCGSAN